MRYAKIVLNVCILSFMFVILSSPAYAAPVPDIKANNVDSVISLTTTDTLTLTASLDAGTSEGVNADWWVVASTPFGWYYYVHPDQWYYAPDLSYVQPAHQGPLFTLGPVGVLNTSGLPPGTYTAYFGVDTVMNGQLDFGQLYFNAAVVNIGSSVPGGTGDVDEYTKEKVRLAVISANNLIAAATNSVDQVINSAIENFDCPSFSTSIYANLVINNSVHNAYASGSAALYNGGNVLSCNYFYSGNFSVQKADIQGGGSIRGNEINADFQGSFTVTGSSGYLTSGSIFTDLYISDYFFINGSGTMQNINLAGVQYPDVSGNVSDVKVSVMEALSVLYNILDGHNVTLGTMAQVVKDGYIYAQTLDCPVIDIHFNGTNMVDVSAPCVSQSQFKVDLDTGAIIE